MSISLCMIVKDEARFLRQCLESAKDLVDEIIIVDTGSKDKTVEIAEEFGAKVFNFKWSNDFSAARNFSISKATKEWILVLDADETISQQDILSIKNVTKMKDLDGFFFTARNYANFQQSFNWEKYNDRYEESKKYDTWYGSEIVRLFRNKKGYRFNNKVNEMINVPKGKLARTGIPIHHFAWERFANMRALRRAALKKRLAEALKKDPDDLKANYELARAYIEEKDFKSAESHLKKAIEAYEKLKDDKKKPMKGWLLYESLGQTYLFMRRYEEAIDVLERYLKVDENNPGANALLAQALVILEKYKEAAEHFKTALHFSRSNPNMPISIDQFFNSYGIALLNIGKLKEAAHSFAEVSKANPLNANAYNNLGVVFLKMRNIKNALIVFKKSIELDHPSKNEIQKVVDRLESKLNKK